MVCAPFWHQRNFSSFFLFLRPFQINMAMGLELGVFIYLFIFLAHFHFPASGQAVVTGVVPSPPRFLPSIFIAHRVQQSHCSSIVHRMLLTHALALSASQFVHKKKSQRIYTSEYALGGARTHETDLYQARG